MRLIFTVNQLPHPQPDHLGSRMKLFGRIVSYTGDQIIFKVGKGANVEVIKEVISSYCASRHVKVLNIEERVLMEKEYFYKSVSLIEKALNDVKGNLEVFLEEDIPEVLKGKLLDVFDRLDSTWDEVAGILNRYDDGEFDNVLEGGEC